MVAGGLGLAALAGVTIAVYDAPLSLGPGYGAVAWTDAASRSLGLILVLLVVRAAATSITIAAGGVGGVFIPLFVEGWILGTAVEVVVGSHTLLFPVIGAAAFLGAAYRTPIAAIVFVAEATGRPGYVVPALVATAVAQVVMGRRSVSKSQLARRVDVSERRARAPGDGRTDARPAHDRSGRARVDDRRHGRDRPCRAGGRHDAVCRRRRRRVGARRGDGRVDPGPRVARRVAPAAAVGVRRPDAPRGATGEPLPLG